MASNPLSEALAAAVPLFIERLQERGGPSAVELARMHDLSTALGERGDVLIFGGGRKGEQAELFNRTAEALAILSFLPGGVTLFGSHWETPAPQLHNPDPLRR
jgi:hypothetical protein